MAIEPLSRTERVKTIRINGEPSIVRAAGVDDKRRLRCMEWDDESLKGVQKKGLQKICQDRYSASIDDLTKDELKSLITSNVSQSRDRWTKYARYFYDTKPVATIVFVLAYLFLLNAINVGSISLMPATYSPAVYQRENMANNVTLSCAPTNGKYHIEGDFPYCCLDVASATNNFFLKGPIVFNVRSLNILPYNETLEYSDSIMGNGENRCQSLNTQLNIGRTAIIATGSFGKFEEINNTRIFTETENVTLQTMISTYSSDEISRANTDTQNLKNAWLVFLVALLPQGLVATRTLIYGE